MATFNGMFIVGIIVSIPMTIVFIGEIFNYQFRFGAPWFVRIERRWNAKSLTVMAMTERYPVLLMWQAHQEY